MGKSLGEDIRNLIMSGDVGDLKSLSGYLFSHKVIINFNVLCVGIKYRIRS